MAAILTVAGWKPTPQPPSASIRSQGAVEMVFVVVGAGELWEAPEGFPKPRGKAEGGAVAGFAEGVRSRSGDSDDR